MAVNDVGVLNDPDRWSIIVIRSWRLLDLKCQR